MEFFFKIFYGIIFIIFGLSILKYRKVVHGWTGNFVWAEQYIGRGGTYFVLILIGLGFIFFGAIYPFGGLELLTSK